MRSNQALTGLIGSKQLIPASIPQVWCKPGGLSLGGGEGEVVEVAVVATIATFDQIFPAKEAPAEIQQLSVLVGVGSGKGEQSCVVCRLGGMLLPVLLWTLLTRSTGKTAIVFDPRSKL